MELKQILNSRRSVRKFLAGKVEHDKLQRIVDMALQAPSSRNTRSTRLIVVEQPELLEKMSQMRDYGSAFMKDAQAAIVVMGDKNATDLWLDNCAITATILQLAVVDEGLASCWVHVGDYRTLQDDPESQTSEDYVKALLPEIPEGYRVWSVISIGYADYTPKPLPEYEGPERILFVE